MRRLSWAALISAVLAALSLNPSPNPPVESTAPETTWAAIFSKAPPPASRPPGGSRGDDAQIYAIAPGQIGRAELWSNQPLFVWQGAIRQLELVAASGSAIWSQAVAGEARSIRYPGSPLHPGQAYEWIIYSVAKVPVARVAFQIVGETERSRIAADLAALSAQSSATPEQVALQRASYFADRQLWADVLQEAFSVPNPSDELSEVLRQFGAG